MDQRTRFIESASVPVSRPRLAVVRRTLRVAVPGVLATALLASLNYPPVGRALGLSSTGFGTWARSAIRDTAAVRMVAPVAAAPASLAWVGWLGLLGRCVL